METFKPVTIGTLDTKTGKFTLANREAMTMERIGTVWMQDAEHCISLARAVAVDCMNVLGLDANDFRIRDKIISAISARINQSMNAAAIAHLRAAEPVAIVEDQLGFPVIEWLPNKDQPIGTKLYTHPIEDARDSARLDALEADIAAHGPIVLHNGEVCAAARRGLGLSNTGRTLRQALDQFMEPHHG